MRRLLLKRATLLQLLSLRQRPQGIFRTGKEWVSLSWLPGAEVAVEPIAYRRDSRVELILHRANAAAAGEWDTVQQQLLACLKP